MTHLTDQQIAGFRQRELAPVDLLLVDDHLVECEACRQRAAPADIESRMASMTMSLVDAPADEHPAPETLAAFVVGALDAIAIAAVADHVALCADCAERVQEVRGEIGERVVPLRATRDVSSRKVLDFPAWMARPQTRTFALAATVVLAAAVTVAVWWRTAPTTSPSTQSASRDVGSPAPAAGTGSPARPPADSAAPAATLIDGSRTITLTGEGRLEGLDARRPEDHDLIRRALERRRFDTPAGLPDLIGRQGTLMGRESDSRTGRLIAPIGTRVLDDRPLFRWRPYAGAQAYKVEVSDERFEPASASEWIAATEWRPRAALARGRVWVWQLVVRTSAGEVRVPAPPAPEARFTVLPAADATRLESALEEHRGSHLARAALFARAGVLDEAESELQALATANPASPLVSELLANLRATRRPSR